MIALRATGRGLRDFYENMFRYILASAGWWAAALTIVLIPPATAVLFSLADPRRQNRDDHLSLVDTIRAFPRWFVPSWILAIITILPCFLLGFNIWYYAGDEGPAGTLSLVWMALFLVGVGATLGAFSGLTLFGDSPWNALRAGLGLIVQSLGQSLLLVLVLFVLTTITSFLIIPAVFMLPATIASIVNRYALAMWHVEIVDPNAATEARQAESKRSSGMRRWLSGR